MVNFRNFPELISDWQTFASRYIEDFMLLIGESRINLLFFDLYYLNYLNRELIFNNTLLFPAIIVKNICKCNLNMFLTF